jgi:hypothetical protein
MSTPQNIAMFNAYDTWADNASYAVGDIKYYLTNSNYYICKAAHTVSSGDILPTNTTYWALITGVANTQKFLLPDPDDANSDLYPLALLNSKFIIALRFGAGTGDDSLGDAGKFTVKTQVRRLLSGSYLQPLQTLQEVVFDLSVQEDFVIFISNPIILNYGDELTVECGHSEEEFTSETYNLKIYGYNEAGSVSSGGGGSGPTLQEITDAILAGTQDPIVTDSNGKVNVNTANLSLSGGGTITI